jgi:hypothetical protein
VFLRVDDKLENQLKIKVRKEWGDKDIDNVVQNIKNVLDYPSLLSVFRLDSREVHEIDIAILTALLQGEYFKLLQKHFFYFRESFKTLKLVRIVSHSCNWL